MDSRQSPALGSGLCYCTLLLACCSISGAEIVLQTTFHGTCADQSNQQSVQSIENEVVQHLNSSILPQLYGRYRTIPASSCADIYQGHPSGYYWLNVTSKPQLVYCSLNENHCCNESDGKWMRIAYLNMSDPSVQCPDGWREVQSPIRTCRRQNSTGNTGINSVNYTSYGIPYSRVCGRIVAYQFESPDGFLGYITQHQSTIDNAYVDGISITFGYPRNHIWTFAATQKGQHNCPCIMNRNTTARAPPFVDRDFFCEVGISNTEGTFITTNPLWDGQGCAGSSACCEFNNPPWFCKQLDQPTTEDIEIRIMSYVTSGHSLEEEDTPVQLIEIFIQ